MKYNLVIGVSLAVLFTAACGPAEFSAVTKPGEEYGSVTQTGDPADPGGPNVPVTVVVDDPAQAANYPCKDGSPKIAICHVPEGNPDNRHTLCLPQPAITAHLAQHDASAAANDEDYLGECK